MMDPEPTVPISHETLPYPGRAVQLTISLPADLLEQIDRYAGERGFTRSGFLHRAVKEYLK
jgi:hypothetical protein